MFTLNKMANANCLIIQSSLDVYIHTPSIWLNPWSGVSAESVCGDVCSLESTKEGARIGTRPLSDEELSSATTIVVVVCATTTADPG